VATSTSLLGSFTCRKFTTWDRRLYFSSEGRRAEDFFARKIRRLRISVVSLFNKEIYYLVRLLNGSYASFQNSMIYFTLLSFFHKAVKPTTYSHLHVPEIKSLHPWIYLYKAVIWYSNHTPSFIHIFGHISTSKNQPSISLSYSST